MKSVIYKGKKNEFIVKDNDKEIIFKNNEIVEVSDKIADLLIVDIVSLGIKIDKHPRNPIKIPDEIKRAQKEHSIKNNIPISEYDPNIKTNAKGEMFFVVPSVSFRIAKESEIKKAETKKKENK